MKTYKSLEFIPRKRIEAGTAIYFDPETMKVYESGTGEYIGDMEAKTGSSFSDAYVAAKRAPGKTEFEKLYKCMQWLLTLRGAAADMVRRINDEWRLNPEFEALRDVINELDEDYLEQRGRSSWAIFHVGDAVFITGGKHAGKGGIVHDQSDEFAWVMLRGVTGGKLIGPIDYAHLQLADAGGDAPGLQAELDKLEHTTLTGPDNFPDGVIPDGSRLLIQGDDGILRELETDGLGKFVIGDPVDDDDDGDDYPVYNQ